MTRGTLNRQEVLAAAGELINRAPDKQLTLGALADHLGIKPPSLFKHVKGLDGLRSGMTVAAKRQLATTLQAAVSGLAGESAIRELSKSYVGWAQSHPGQYPLTIVAPDASDTADVEVSGELLLVVSAPLKGYALNENAEIQAIRFLRSALHGFVSLQAQGAFAMALPAESTLELIVDSFVGSLAAAENGQADLG